MDFIMNASPVVLPATPDGEQPLELFLAGVTWNDNAGFCPTPASRQRFISSKIP
jgi:hypothetical protein